MAMRFAVWPLPLQTVSDGINLFVASFCNWTLSLIYLFIKEELIYEAAQNCYPDNQQGFASR